MKFPVGVQAQGLLDPTKTAWHVRYHQVLMINKTWLQFPLPFSLVAHQTQQMLGQIVLSHVIVTSNLRSNNK